MQNEQVEHPEAFEQVETLSELLRIGKDEMNLAEFPMTSLSDRPVSSEVSLKFEDQIYDDRKKKLITRKRIIEGSKEYGLPTATDDSVILALIQLTKLKNGFASREVEFTRYELLNLLNWPNKGQSYERIAQSLHRVAGVTYHFENSWWDNRRKAWTSKIFGIIDTVELNDSRGAGGQGGSFNSRIIWNQIILDSFQAGYLRSLDFKLAMSFKHPISMRVYRFMGKRFHLKPEWLFDLKDFAYEHIGLSKNYEGGTQIARKLQPALTELESVGFLEPLNAKGRFIKKGRDWSIRLTRTAGDPVVSIDLEQLEEPEPPRLVAELVQRGVSGLTAKELVQQYPDRIEAQLDVFDWLTEKQDKKLAQNPAGYLVKSIRENYVIPTNGYISKVERQRREEARLAKDRQLAEQRLCEREQEVREQAERKAIAAYWQSLTPEQQAELDIASRENADPALLAAEAGPFKRMGRQLRRDVYIRQLLAIRKS